MQRLTSEQYLDTEDFWKDYFEVKFIKENKSNGSEMWKVTNIETGDSVLCNSMLAAFKIAHTACERLEGYSLSIDHSNILRKAGELLGYNILNYREKMSYMWWNGEVWRKPKATERPIYIPGETNRKEFLEKFSNRVVCKCEECGNIFTVSEEDKLECEICTATICKKCLKNLFNYSIEEIKEDGIICRACCEYSID